MQKQINEHFKDLKSIDNQRKAWLVLSAVVVVAVGLIIFQSTRLQDLHILWTIGSLGIVLAVVWWYWAMHIINKIVSHRAEELEILVDLCETIGHLKDELRKSYGKGVD